MITIHALVDEPLMVGPLSQHRQGAEHRRPYLQLAAFCNHCRSFHHHRAPDAFALEAVLTVEASCPSGPFAGRPIAVGADPSRAPEHRRVLEHFRAALRRWKSEARFRHELARERARDRAHRREWGEVHEASAEVRGGLTRPWNTDSRPSRQSRPVGPGGIVPGSAAGGEF